ncbi:probable leucine-rich repeat receptor-like protein kinase At1g68400 [Cannabis sativa]|uniref:probable leucine-rich repeat receptor-like protein kinase At1g68400 n=1 Tax=Cannabis sativa TaxID=3483 RepID=UPI0029C9CC83|nr:probable leucine-rich repeat receptor-like protein kinase At1g68400 [Cannabis sativa]
MLTNRVTITAFILTQFISISFSSDITALLSFKASSDRSNSLSSWVNSSDPCSDHWLGVTCDSNSGRVTRLVLENLQLTGSTRSLSELTELRLLSLKQNLLTSSNLNLSSWPNLKHLYLSHNRFAGKFPAGISTLRRLRRIDLSHNEFRGKIPFNELTRLTHLLTLRLEFNSFDSELAAAAGAGDTQSFPSTVSDFNVSNNNLSGEIPIWLSHFSASSFAGNSLLCGHPLSSQCPKNDPTAENQSHILLITIITVASVAILGVIAFVLINTWRKKRITCQSREHSYNGGGGSSGGPVLVTFEGCSKGIGGVEDLLRASAVMLGKGSVGTTYRVAVDGGDRAAEVVVKRVRKGCCGGGSGGGGKEVDWWLRQVLGNLRHSNIVSLRAYCYSNSEDLLLLVYDFLPNGTLHSLLHGNRGPGRTPLGWSTRLKIASHSSKAIAFLHNNNNKYADINLFHGHITSTNIILDRSSNACITDVCLHQLLRLQPPHNAYAAPELTTTTSPSKYTQKCDVYSFGVVLIEILSGKIVEKEEDEEEDEEENIVMIIKKINDMNFMEVLDYELFVFKDVMEEEIIGLMEIARLCLAPLPKDRPDMNVVYRMIEDIRKKRVDKNTSRDHETTSIMDELILKTT